MGQLIPTPAPLEDLINEASDLNTFNDGVKTQAVSPRSLGAQIVLVQVSDDPLTTPTTSGTADADVLNSLSDSGADFVADGIEVGYSAVNTADGSSAIVTAVTTNVLTLGTTDAFPLGTETYKVLAHSYWEQKFGGGEWQKSGLVDGGNKEVAYTLPVDTNTVNVHQVVYPWDLADIANYPTK